MQPVITVTGATGHVGRALADQLLQHGAKLRAVARTAEHLAPLRAAGADVYAVDIENTAMLTEALRGADVVFALIPEQPTAADFHATKYRMATRLAEAVAAANVPRVVALSAYGVAPPSGIGPTAVNGAFEHMLRSIEGLSVVALRAAYFMENHLASIPVIQHAGINVHAFRDDVALPMIATRDIAAVAAQYLLQPTFEGYSVRKLLGPRNYTFREVTAILGAAIGKPDLPYVSCSYEDLCHNLIQAGLSASTAAAIAETPRAYNENRVQRSEQRNAANTTPTTLEAFAHEVFAPAYAASAPAYT